MVDKSNTKPLHMQAEQYLRKLISNDEFVNGKLLPAEIDIAKNLGISRNTIRQAINRLVFEGLLVRKKGLGTKVVKPQVIGHGQGWKSFTQELRALGMNPKNYEMHVSWVKANTLISGFFNIKPGTEVLMTERLRGNDKEPFVFFTSYFNPNIGLSGQENFNEPLYSMLNKCCNVTVKTSNEIITAGTAGALASKKLNIMIGDPILRRERKVYDKNNLPIEYNTGIYKADSFSYSITLIKDTND